MTPNITRKKGFGGTYYSNSKPLLYTYIVNSIENFTNYVFRSDMAYDWQVDVNNVLNEITRLHEDRLDNYQKQFDKYNFIDYKKEIPEDELDRIRQSVSYGLMYHDGLDVNTTYTSLAHYWLLKDLLNYERINFVTDDDDSTKSALTRVFKDEIKENKALIFISKVDKELTLPDAQLMSKNKKFEIDKELAIINQMFLPNFKIEERDYIISLFADRIREMNKYEHANGLLLNSEFLVHLLPNSDEGRRWIRCMNDLSKFKVEDIAKMYYYVNPQAINGFHNELRERLYLLDRSSPSSRQEETDYGHAPKRFDLIQKQLTIFRTWHNFCKNVGTESNPITPAIKLGIADKQYTIQEIKDMK